MSSTPPPEARPEAMGAALAPLLNRNVTGVERIGGGRNSQIHRVTTEGGRCFALKSYFRHPADTRDRLATEFGSLSYLWQNGVREIPQPIAAAPERNWAVYEFIDGDSIPASQAGEADVAAAVDLLGRLRELSRRPESRQLPPASEAFFSARAIVDNVRQRWQRLRAAAGESPAPPALGDWLEKELMPLLEQVTRWSESRVQAAGLSFEQELAWEQRTLSPSDFGFHNALRRRDGRLIFLDFEYFGWDDPAKMIADFLLHPAMDLTPDLKKKFAAAVLRRFSDWPALSGRVEALYPLFGLKWCAILLNEFLPEQLRRRQFAATAPADRAALQARQLDQARRMLDRVKAEYENFPYRD